jgi:hypothetical protein
MKLRHNKKRNTAFVYEALVREATVAILKEDVPHRDKVIKIIKKHFKEGSPLKQELDCYRSLYEARGIATDIAKRILTEAKMASRLLDINGLFVSQSDLIADVNKEITPEVFNNFVPNYKTLATISQMFSPKISPKNRVMLENQILGTMTAPKPPTVDVAGIDNITYKTFVGKFNTKYDDGLLQEQKELLTRYISSFSDNAIELKIYLNTEIARLKDRLAEAKKVKEIKNDEEMLQKTEAVIRRLESFATSGITEEVLMTVLKTQSLVEEIHNGDNN